MLGPSLLHEGGGGGWLRVRPPGCGRGAQPAARGPLRAAARAPPAARGCMLGPLSEGPVLAGQGRGRVLGLGHAQLAAALWRSSLQGLFGSNGGARAHAPAPLKAASCAGRAGGRGSMQHVPWEGCIAAQKAPCTQKFVQSRAIRFWHELLAVMVAPWESISHW